MSTQFGVRPMMSAARRRIDAAGHTFQALKAARDKGAGDRAPKRATRTDAATARPNADPNANAPARALWFWPCFQSGETLDIAEPSDSLPDILFAVSAHYGVSVTDLKSQRRHKRLILPRHVFCYLAATATRKSLPQIGAVLGDRDHTTVLHAVRNIKGMIEDGRLSPDDLPNLPSAKPNFPKSKEAEDGQDEA